MTWRRSAVVTGAASGIGYAVAERLLTSGRGIVMLDRDQVALEAAATTLDPSGDNVLPIVCDVSEHADVHAAAATTRDQRWRPDVLVCAAGWSPNKPFMQLELDEMRRVVDVNLYGALHCCHAFYDLLQDNTSARIVLISSDAARIGTPKETVYAAAKSGLHAFAKAFAIEIAQDGVTINVVSPGSTDTPMLREMLAPEQIERRVRANPMKRLGTPDDVANAILFFCADESSFITGQVLSVNGGFSRVD